MTGLLILRIAIACAIAGTAMLLTAIALHAKWTYPHKEVK